MARRSGTRGRAASRTRKGASAPADSRGGYRWRNPSQGDTQAVSSSRPLLILAVFAAILVVLVVRLVWLQVVVADEYAEDAYSERLTTAIVVEARRGTIYDRNGTVLAISVDAKSIWAYLPTDEEIENWEAEVAEALANGEDEPTQTDFVEDVESTAAMLANATGGDVEEYYAALTSKSSGWVRVADKIDVVDGDAAEGLALAGITVVDDMRREYPCGQVGGQIVGCCNVATGSITAGSGTDTYEYYYGYTGLEAQYDDVLSGTVGYYTVELTASGSYIAGTMEEVEAVDGQDIIVSIDIELQEYVEQALVEGMADLGTDDGTAIVMDASTGEIYAAASLPLFDPSDRSEVEEGATQLRCVSDLFEPGSAFKTVAALALLESDTMTPDTEIYCPESVTVDGYVITDSHTRAATTMTLSQVLAQSSNVGISLATKEMGFDELYDAIIRYNLHEATGVDYPGENQRTRDTTLAQGYLSLFQEASGLNDREAVAQGYLLDYEDWATVTGYNISFGQGISVTPLMITRFYCALANDGVECTPHFLVSYPRTGENVEYATEQIIDDEEALADIVEMLKGVVTDGTGTAAAIEGFEVAGKTSTAQIYDEVNGGYQDGVYYLAFVGFLADSSSDLVCFVGANEVVGTGVVTPIFQNIMTKAIERFGITS